MKRISRSPLIFSARSWVSLLCLVFYVVMVFANFTNNEFEEQFNSGVLAMEHFEDFDGDGKFDLDQEDDEEGNSKVSKSFIGDWLPLSFYFDFSALKKVYGLAIFRLRPQAVISEIFQPPKP